MDTPRYFEDPNDPLLFETIHHWQQLWPDGVCFALLAETNTEDIPALQSKCNSIEYPLLGAIFPELIVYARFKAKGVVLLLLTHLPYYQLVDDVPSNEIALKSFISAFSNGIEKQLDTENENNSLFLIFDCLLPNISTILERIYFHLSDSLHYFGVNAGSERFTPGPCLFDNHNFLKNSMMALLLPNHPGAVLAHNYHHHEPHLTATSTDGNRINSIDGRPAFEVYQELVETQFGVVMTVENFYAYGVHFPFGINCPGGEPLVRIPVDVQEDGSLHCVGEIPPNTSLTLLEALPAGSMETIDAITTHPQLASGELVLNFYCAGRRLHMDKAAHAELHAFGERLRPLNIMGAVSLGEIGNSMANGHPNFHNAALLALPWHK